MCHWHKQQSTEVLEDAIDTGDKVVRLDVIDTVNKVVM